MVHLARRPALCLSSPADLVALGPQRGLRAVGDADLREDAGQVRLDRLLADLEPARDQLVGQALGDEREDLALARR